MRPGLKNYILLTGTLVFANWLNAASLQPGHVPADPSFVMHLDVDRIRPTAVGQYLLTELEKPDAENRFAAFQAIFNFDPRKQLHGLTVYNKTMAPEDGVLLVYADLDPGRLVTLAKTARDYQSKPYKQHVIHHWVDDKKKMKDGVQPRTYAAMFGAHTVVFGQKESSVAGALDVLDGRERALVSTSLWPFGNDSGNGYLQAVARKISLPDSDPNAAILRLAKFMQLKLGEERGQVLGTLTMATESESVASNVAGIAKGLISLMKLQSAKPGNVRLADALTLEQQGQLVMLNLAMPSEQVVDLMKQGAARKTAKEVETK